MHASFEVCVCVFFSQQEAARRTHSHRGVIAPHICWLKVCNRLAPGVRRFCECVECVCVYFLSCACLV